MFLSLSMLRSFPISRPNADDVGEQKSTRFADTQRSRISSQCVKRAVRKVWQKSFEKIDNNRLEQFVGVRTASIGDRIVELAGSFTDDENLKQAVAYGIVSVFFDEENGKKGKKGNKNNEKKTKKDDENDENEEEISGKEQDTAYLVFSSNREIKNILQHVFDAMKKDVKLLEEIKKENGFPPEFSKSIKKQIPKPTHLSVDTALYGRMQARARDYEIYAALQMAHAISVNALNEELDYFVAVDDLKEEQNKAGAGHLDTLSCNSSCYYFHTNICIDKLIYNLDGNVQLAADACARFVEAMVMTVPDGKQNSHDHRTLPEFIMVEIHDGQSVNLVNAFDPPVKADGKSSLASKAIKRLIQYREKLIEQYGPYYPQKYVLSSGNIRSSELQDVKIPNEMNFPDLLQKIASLCLLEASHVSR